MNLNCLVSILVAVIILELIFIIFFIIVNKMFRDELKQCKDVNKNLRKLVDTWRSHYLSLKSFYDLAGDAQIDKLQREIQVLRTMLAQKWEESSSKITSSNTVVIDNTEENHVR